MTLAVAGWLAVAVAAPATTRSATRTVPMDTSVQGTIQVYCTSALQNAMLEIANAFRARYKNATVITSFGGTAELRGHLEQGSPVDVFVVGDTANAGVLQRHSLLLAPRVIARGRVGVIARAGGPVATLADLARPGVRVLVGTPDSPIGRYTEQTLARMSRARQFGGSYVAKVRANVTAKETSSRGAVLRVAKGEADASFAYATDAEMSKIKIVLVPIPDSLAVPVLFSAAATNASSAPELSAQFVAWLSDSFARVSFQRHGFRP
jgi:molybdate transport system substrate-binding protein